MRCFAVILRKLEPMCRNTAARGNEERHQRSQVISESVFQVFNNFSHSNSTDLRGFWHHSLSAAVMAREIAEKMRYPHVEEAYLAGLLHDVGRLALLAAAPQSMPAIFSPRMTRRSVGRASTLKITMRRPEPGWSSAGISTLFWPTACCITMNRRRDWNRRIRSSASFCWRIC